MIQFNVNGRLLDLPEKINMQFTRKNPLFAFDNLECERSTSFDVPATPKNDLIFGLSRMIAGTGAGMRTRYEAQLQADGVAKNGYLYVTSATRDKYKCVFVCGELLGLQRLRDAGKIKDIYNSASVSTWGDAGYAPNTYKDSLYLPIKYLQENTTENAPFVSIRLFSLAQNCAQNLGARVTFPTGAWRYVRIIPNEQNGLSERSVTYHRRGTSPMSTSDEPNVTSAYFSGAFSGLFSTSYAKVAYRVDQGQQITMYYGKLAQLVPKQEITIQFPTNFPNDIFIGHFIDGGTQLAAECQFYGDYEFDSNLNVTGTPLAGRAVTIPANEPFAFVSLANDYKNGYESGGAHVQGWFYGGYPTQIDEAMTMSGKVVFANPRNVVNILDNLPDCTFVELLKVIAALTGTVLNYDETNGVTFDELECSTWNVIDLTGKVLETGEMTRTFGDYAQTNKIEFDTSEHVLEVERISRTYTVQNENIAADKTLFKIPFDEGGASGELLITRDADGYDKPVLAQANTTRPSMIRVSLPNCDGLQALLDASTAVTIKARLSLLEFDRMTADTAFYYVGVRYVWTEAQWSKGVATLKLSKIDA